MFLKGQDVSMWSGFTCLRTGAGGSILRKRSWRSRVP